MYIIINLVPLTIFALELVYNDQYNIFLKCPFSFILLRVQMI